MNRFVKKRAVDEIDPEASPTAKNSAARRSEPSSGVKVPRSRRKSADQTPTPFNDEAHKDNNHPVEPVEKELECDVKKQETKLKDFYMDKLILVEIARSAWKVAGETSGVASRCFDTSSLIGLPDGRLPFKFVAMALEAGDGNSQQCLRALTNVFKWVLQRSSDRRADLIALLATLTAPPTPHPQLVFAVGSAFKLKIPDGSAMTAYNAPRLSPEQLPNMALQARKGQSALFTKGLAMTEVAAVVDPILRQHAAKWADEHHQYGPPLIKLFGKAVVEQREIWHLIRTLQGKPGPRKSTVLRALAYAYYLHSAGNCDEVNPESMALCDKAIYHAWATRVGDPGLLIDQILALDNNTLEGGRSPELTVIPCCGCWVRPMKPHAVHSLEGALEKFKNVGAVRAEWFLDGLRAQVHIKSVGDSSCIQVFTYDGLDTNAVAGCNTYAEEVATALEGNLKDADGVDISDAILEVMLLWRTEGARLNGVGPHCMVIFDTLALSGKALMGLSLRERRNQLESSVTETSRLKLAPGIELAMETPWFESAKTELVNAYSASVRSREGGNTECPWQASGLIFKALDGPRSEYFPGLCAPCWQAYTPPPVVTGLQADEFLFSVLTEEEQAKLPGPEDLHYCLISARRAKTEEGRTDIMTVQQQFKACGVSPRWYVDEESLEDYRSIGLDAVVGGTVVYARNMALVDAENMNKACVQISDDISKWQYFIEEGGWTKKTSLQEANAVGRSIARYQVSPVAAARFILAKLRGSPLNPRPQLGGVLPHFNPGQAMMTPPFGFQHFILGDFFVVDKSPCRFDTRMTLKEDYDLTCAHLKEHGSVIRCNHLIVQAKHETNAGGACSIRDAAGERERENIKILKEKYPGAFIDNVQRANQVRLDWKGHLRWLRENGGGSEERSSSAS